MADDDKGRIAELERLIAVLEGEMRQLQNDLQREMKAKRELYAITQEFIGINLKLLDAQHPPELRDAAERLLAKAKASFDAPNII
jgi:hypothetical protein